MVRVTLLLTIALAGVTGCAETVLPQSYLGTVLGPKAAFDLQCPADQLQFANLGPPDMDLLARDGEQVGQGERRRGQPAGCDGLRKARAVHLRQNAHGVDSQRGLPDGRARIRSPEVTAPPVSGGARIRFLVR